MNTHNLLRTLPVALALIFAVALTAQAQTPSSSPTGPGNTVSNKAGEAFPNDPNAANKNKPQMKVITQAENSTPVKATKRVAKKTKKAVVSGGTKAGNAIRNTGDKINAKVPPGPEDGKK